MPPSSPVPLNAASDVFGAEIAGYSVLQLTLGAFAVAGVVAGLRWAYGKALGKG